MKSLINDIKTSCFKKLYVLHGEEKYLLHQYKTRLVKAIDPEENSINVSFLEGKDASVTEVSALATTIPFFTNRRVIVLTNTGWLKNKSEEAAEFFSGELPGYLTVIFVEDDIDKRNKLYKITQKKGYVAEFGVQTESCLSKWISNKAVKAGKKFSQSDIRYFIGQVGTDMYNLSNEFDKLSAYSDQEIKREDIDVISKVQITNRIFDMVQYVSEGKQALALKLYDDLLELREAPVKLLYLVTREFSQLMLIRAMLDNQKGADAIAAGLGIPSFAVRKKIPIAKKYNYEQLKTITDECLDYNTDVRIGNLPDVLAIELVIIKYSGVLKRIA